MIGGGKYISLGLAASLLVIAATVPAQSAGEEAGGDTAGVTASQPNYQPFDLGEVIVTAEKPPAVQGTAITSVMNAVQIAATNSHTVAEALRFMPGVRVATVKKNQALVSIHGFSQSRVLVLIDGVPYFETRYGFLDLNQINVDNIARIEVVKGGSSVLYGANDLAGVVNIITKQGNGELTAQLTGEVGSNSFNREALSNSWHLGRMNYWLSYAHEHTGDYRMSGDFLPQTGSVKRTPGATTRYILEDGGDRKNSDYDQHSVWAKLGINPNESSEYYLNGHYIAKKKGDPPSIYGGNVFVTAPCFSQVDDRITRYNDWGLDFSGRHDLTDRFALKGKLFYHHHADQYTSYADADYDSVIAVSDYRDYSVGGFFSGDFQPAEWDSLRFAFHYQGNDHQERADRYQNYEDYFSTTGSLGLENEYRRIRDLSVVLGVNYDWFKVSKAMGDYASGENYDRPRPGLMDGFCSMIGAHYALGERSRLYGSVARKLRFPTLDQLYSSKGGNVYLQPEKAVNYTLGIAHSFSRHLDLDVAGFHHELTDFISRDGDPNTNPAALFQNTAKVRMTGVEVNGELHPFAASTNWQDFAITVGYTYNDARDASSDRVTKDVTGVPMHTVNVGLHSTIPVIETRLDLTGLYMGNYYNQLPTPRSPTQAVQKVLSYYTMNARLSKTFLKHLEAYVAVDNILDRAYEADYGLPAPGRSYYVGLSARY